VTNSSPEQVARELIEEGFNGRRLELCDALTAPGFVEHQDFGPNHADGAEGVKAVIDSLHRAFADFRLDIEHLSVDGELVWLHLRAGGRNEGSFMGHPPTGRTISIDVFDLLRVVDGRLVEHWGVPDRLGALLQLELVRPPVRSAA
jgi:predicted ester cyclase